MGEEGIRWEHADISNEKRDQWGGGNPCGEGPFRSAHVNVPFLTFHSCSPFPVVLTSADLFGEKRTRRIGRDRGQIANSPVLPLAANVFCVSEFATIHPPSSPIQGNRIGLDGEHRSALEHSDFCVHASTSPFIPGRLGEPTAKARPTSGQRPNCDFRNSILF